MILDAHTHLFPAEVCRRREDFFADEPAFKALYDSPKSRLVDPEEFVAALEEEGVEAAVTSGFPWRQERLWRRQHEVILEAMRRWPRKIIGFCNVNPLDPAAPREVERCLAAGFRGIGELAWYVDDPGDDLEYFMTPLAELAQHYKAPVMLHMNDPVGAPYAGKAAIRLEAIYALIRKFPEVTWILAHWGGGLPFYGLLKKEVPEVFRRVYLRHRGLPLSLSTGNLPVGRRNGGARKNPVRQRLPPAAPQTLSQGDGGSQPAGGLAADDPGGKFGPVAEL
jgi:uncharacterized protein